MIRKLLATTAMAGLFATGALAQETVEQPITTPADPAVQGDMTAPADGTMAPADTAATPPATTEAPDATAAAAGGAGYLQSLSGDQYLVSELDGQSIYVSDAADAETLGSIQNYLVDADGQIVAAIVDATVNDESRTVAVPFEQISWSMVEGNEPRAVMTGGLDQLGQAPVFVDRTTVAAADPALAPADPAMAPAGGMAATDPALAPATDPALAPATTDTAAAGDPMAGDAMQTAAAPGETMQQTNDQYLTDSLIGQDIRTAAADDAETIGEVNDLVVSSSGQVEAAVVGVGGFLGIGQKNVAVPFENFQVTRDEGEEPLFVLAATQEQLEQAPAFEGDRNVVAMTEGGAATGTDLGQQAAATGAAAGAATGAAIGSAADATQDVAANAGTTIENAADAAGDSIESAATTTGNALESAGNEIDQTIDGSTELAQNQTGMGTTGADVTDPAAGGALTGETAVAPGAGDPIAGTDASTTASTGGAMQEGMTPVENSAQLTAAELMGTTVYGPNDERLGSVGDIAMSGEGQVDAVIVDVGGFLGIGAKPVAVGLDNIQLMRDGGNALYLYTQFTQDQLENAPAYDADAYADNRDTMRLQSTAAPAAAPATTVN